MASIQDIIYQLKFIKQKSDELKKHYSMIQSNCSRQVVGLPRLSKGAIWDLRQYWQFR